MLGDVIRDLRKQRGMSQQVLAEKLNVVRQTVSKWEKGLSVPDGEMILRIGAVFQVPVSKLLEVEQAGSDSSHTQGLDQMKEQLEQIEKKQQALCRWGKKRGVILWLCFLSCLTMMLVKDEMLCLFLTGGCAVAAARVWHKNLPLLLEAEGGKGKSRAAEMVAGFDQVILVVGILLAVLTSRTQSFGSEQAEKLLAMAMMAAVMGIGGVLGSKLPYCRYMGLRLPWTVQDEDTWNAAHRMLGLVSVPIALLYIGCSVAMEPFEGVTFFAVGLWIGIPAAVSYKVFRKKMYGK